MEDLLQSRGLFSKFILHHRDCDLNPISSPSLVSPVASWSDGLDWEGLVCEDVNTRQWSRGTDWPWRSITLNDWVEGADREVAEAIVTWIGFLMSSGVTCGLSGWLKTRLAATFWTICEGFTVHEGREALQQSRQEIIIACTKSWVAYWVRWCLHLLGCFCKVRHDERRIAG